MKPKPVRIANADATGFVVSTDGHDRAIRWEEVEQVTAFKRDLYTVDMVCLLILFGSDQSILELNEQMDGYNSFITAMDANLAEAMPWAQWFMAVAFPAFETNALCIYRRSGQPDPLPDPPLPGEDPKPTIGERIADVFCAVVLQPIYKLTSRFEKRD